MTPLSRPYIFALSLLTTCFMLPTLDANAKVTHYIVPALSSEKYMADVKPRSAREGAPLRIVSARDEYEPGSFLLHSDASLDSVVLSWKGLSGADGMLPKSAISVKVVKRWYQAGTAWQSYFGDSNRRELTPELLLHDENLIKVDHKTKDNYLRVGDKYTWVSYPHEKAEKFFDYFNEPVADSASLQPIRLEGNQYKQLWVTIHVPKSTAPGVYRGAIEAKSQGTTVATIPIELRVLPFALPRPKTYHNVDQDFLVTIYGSGILPMCKTLGVPDEEAKRQQMLLYKNLLAHNVFHIRAETNLNIDRKTGKTNEADLRAEIQQIKAAGFEMKPLLSSVMMWMSPWYGDRNEKDFQERMRRSVEIMSSEVGHKDIYLTTWDEAGVDRIKQFRGLAEYVSSLGVKLWATTHKGRHFDLAGYSIGLANHGGKPSRERADMWHSIGTKVASYAGPHTGPENPDVFRRYEGLARYKANYDGSFNYKLFSHHHSWQYEKHKANVWNDFQGGQFRRFNLVYPTKEGPVDTLAWEGFREGIDDIRYATLLKQLAKQAMESNNYKASYQAKKALIWLELTDTEKANLDNMRFEIIEHIQKLQALL